MDKTQRRVIPLRWRKSRAVRLFPALLMSLPVFAAAGPARDFVFVTAQDSYADRGDVAMVDSSNGRVVAWIPRQLSPLPGYSIGVAVE